MTVTIASVWAPKWWVSLLIVICLWAFVYLYGSTGLNPFRTSSAALAGALGGAAGAVVGALLSQFFKPSEEKAKWIIIGCMALGFIADNIVGGSVGMMVSWLAAEGMPEDVLFSQILAGLSVGALCGAFVQFLMRNRSQEVANLSFWIILALGGFGGLILAVPGAIVASVICMRRHRASGESSPAPS